MRFPPFVPRAGLSIHRLAPLAGLLACLLPFPAPAQPIHAGLSARIRAGQVVLESGGADGSVITLERSADLRSWNIAAVVHDALRDFPVSTPATGPASHAFYRTRTAPRTPEDDGKNQITLPGDRFLSASGSESSGSLLRWVKWTIDLAEPERVHFQDGGKYPFHHDFAARRLPAASGLSPAEFEAVTLRREGQRFVLGAVVFPADPALAEVGIQIVGREPFPVRQVAGWFKSVRSVIQAPEKTSFHYLPTYEQGGLAVDDIAWLSTEGIHVANVSRWVIRDECYSPGWAFGRLVHVPASEIQSAFSAGRLLYSDLLLTDAVPAEIPLVAGVISLTPATPNSHVAILSRSLGVPFVHVAEADVRQRLLASSGHEFLLLAEQSGREGCRVRSLDLQGQLTPSQRSKLEQERIPPPLEITKKAVRGSLSLAVRDLGPADLRHVGGKAAHFGLIIRSVPANAETNAVAFTFDLWDAFLDQVLPGGRTLRTVIRETLAPHRFPPNLPTLRNDLAALRERIRNVADFTPAAKHQILAALAGFEPKHNLRFRSSTNVEDSETFSGAGLYDSYSGCPADDSDADGQGPSHCDPSESGERGVFRALRRVYASFYNENAFLARLRHGVEEDSAGMAVLVHASTPDDTELANGVATLRLNRGEATGRRIIQGDLVTQPGAFSVANPPSNAPPEVVVFDTDGSLTPTLRIERGSSLLPLGRTVLGGTNEYVALIGLFDRVASAWLEANPGRTQVVLDFEYKKVTPGRLLVKQVREIPQNTAANRPPPFVLGDAGRLTVFQHHGKDLFANHRLKSIWQFRSLSFPGDGTAGGFNYEVDVEHHDGLWISTYSGPLNGLPGSNSSLRGPTLTHSWNWGEGVNRREMQLKATFNATLDPARPRPLSDAILIELSAVHARPQPWFGEGNDPVAPVIRDVTRLVPLDKIMTGALERKRSFRRGRIRVDVDYTLSFLKFGVAGIGIFDGKSFPLVRWGTTTLHGLTRSPIVLRGEFSRTYDSSRHNFDERFLFEPRLEPGLEPAVLAELEAANIKAVLVSQFTASDGTQPRIWLWGYEDRLREVLP